MRTLVAGICLLAALGLNAQHDHAHDSLAEADNHNGEHAVMTHAFSLHLPMSRNGSGTAWLPDSTPMFGVMKHAGGWMYMLHGNLFIRYNRQDVFRAGKRGGEKADAVSWIMGMAQRKLGRKGLIRISTMVSADPFFGGNGYPLLFQTGESWKGEPLVDRQHPHDLVSEISVAYSFSFNEQLDAYVYAGMPGEPALGSVAFMHRVSSLYNPDAPLSHHWNDGTHITFGVATAGLRYRKWKIESSVFTGREPDEDRFTFDAPKFDSYSARISYNPNPALSFQLSQGFVKSPEIVRPGLDVNRTVASVIYSHNFGADRFISGTGLWAMNSSDHAEHAFLLEAAFSSKRLALYSRYEFIQKSSEELYLKEMNGHHAVYSINAITLGASYDIAKLFFTNAAIGAQFSLFYADEHLHSLYGKLPVSAELYIRVYPKRMRVSQ